MTHHLWKPWAQHLYLHFPTRHPCHAGLSRFGVQAYCWRPAGARTNESLLGRGRLHQHRAYHQRGFDTWMLLLKMTVQRMSCLLPCERDGTWEFVAWCGNSLEAIQLPSVLLPACFASVRWLCLELWVCVHVYYNVKNVKKQHQGDAEGQSIERERKEKNLNNYFRCWNVSTCT